MENHVEMLSGERLYLRPVEESDLERCQRWINDPEVRNFLTQVFPMDMKSQRAWFDGQARGNPRSDIVLSVVLREGHLHIGNMGIHRINWVHRHGTTGTLIGERDYWGKGYGTEAKLLLLEYAFNMLGLHRLSSEVLSSNPRSLRCQLKCGYVEEGRRRQLMFKNGVWVDEIMLGILAEDWRAAKGR